MIKINGVLSLVSLFLFIPFLTFGTIITSQTDGNWHTAGTWDSNSVPLPGDSVIINGHEVDITLADVDIAYLKIVNNATATNTSLLDINGNIVVNIIGDFVAEANNIAQTVKVQIRSSSIVNVSGGMYFSRSSDNVQNHSLALNIFDTGHLSIGGVFKFDYASSGGFEAAHEVEIYDQGYFAVGGASAITQKAGTGFTMTVYGQADAVFNDSLDISMLGGFVMNVSVDGSATLDVEEDLKLSSSGGLSDLYLKLTNGASATVNGNTSLVSNSINNDAEIRVLGTSPTSLDLNGNLIFEALDQGDATVQITSGSKVYLAGNILRPTDYGVISMGTTSGFYFDGNTAQVLPQSSLSGAGSDELGFSNLYLNNTSTEGIVLGGPVTVTDHLGLNDGILHTNNDSILILDDGAYIDLGSSTSYVDGPIIKRGTTSSGGRITLPVGNNGIYAPVQIDEITNATVEYTVEFIGCPPPIGAVTDPLKLVNQSGHWLISRNDGAAVGNIDLYWDDASARGITDMASLVVVGYDMATGYYSLGQSNQTGGIGLGVSGSVRNDIGCPPPIGANLFALGSTSELENALPVELIGFRAFKEADNSLIYLQWETASEENSDYFIVEKSVDGIHFSPIATIQANGNTTSISYYDAVDNEPAKGNNYYRIMQVDQDQLMSFSKLVNVFINGQEDIPIVYPNPVQEQVSVYAKSLANKQVSINIIDSNGQMVYSGQHRAQDGQIMLSPMQINIRKQGLYLLNYEYEGELYSLQFFKSK